MDVQAHKGADEGERPDPYSDLRKRNERRAKIAQLLEAQRERRLRAERAPQVQRQRSSRRGRSD